MLRDGDIDETTMIQIKLLNAIGMQYCADPRVHTAWTAHRLDLASFCESTWANFSEPYMHQTNSSGQLASDWGNWCKVESARRTGYCIWVS